MDEEFVLTRKQWATKLNRSYPAVTRLIDMGILVAAGVGEKPARGPSPTVYRGTVEACEAALTAQ